MDTESLPDTIASPAPEPDGLNATETDDTNEVPELAQNDPSQDDEEKRRRIGVESVPDGYVDILENKELLKKVLRAGDEDAVRPQRGWRVHVNLSVRLHSSDNQDPPVIIDKESATNLELFVGDSDSFSGIDLIVPLMQPKELCSAIIGPRFAYGEEGNAAYGIPPNAILEAEIELIDAEPIDESEMKPQESLRIANLKKDRGNYWYSRGDYSTAINCYKRGDKFLDFYSPLSESELTQLPAEYHELKDQLNATKATILNNTAAAQMKMKADRAALESVEAALKFEPLNFKALYRRAKLLQNGNNVDEALDAYRKALSIEPKNKVVAQEMARLSAKKKQQYNQEKELYKRMIDGLKKGGPDDKAAGSRSSLQGKGPLAWVRGNWALVGSSVMALVSAGLAYSLYQSR